MTVLDTGGRKLWEVGEREDMQEECIKTSSSPITRAIDNKSDEDKTEEERWDEFLTKNVNKRENWRQEKTALGQNHC